MGIGRETVQARHRTLADRLREYLREGLWEYNQRLPPERVLSHQFEVSRNQLRAALQILEDDGLVWRHVGRGTFVGARPVLNLEDVVLLGDLASLEQLIDSRIAIEPALARLAAGHASRSDIDRISDCAHRCCDSEDWRTYEACDNKLHDAIAEATRNKLLIYLFQTLNVVRRSILWDQQRTTEGPDVDHASFSEHDRIIRAIRARDPDAAEAAMRAHLQSVRQRVFVPEARATPRRPGRP